VPTALGKIREGASHEDCLQDESEAPGVNAAFTVCRG
jgi:hypothetical protein